MDPVCRANSIVYGSKSIITNDDGWDRTVGKAKFDDLRKAFTARKEKGEGRAAGSWLPSVSIALNRTRDPLRLGRYKKRWVKKECPVSKQTSVDLLFLADPIES